MVIICSLLSPTMFNDQLTVINGVPSRPRNGSLMVFNGVIVVFVEKEITCLITW